MTRRWLSCLPTLFVLTCLAGVAHAQVEQGGITGRVFDEGGGVVPAASVKVTENGTGVVRETLTNEAGQYTVLCVVKTASGSGTDELSADRAGSRCLSRA